MAGTNQMSLWDAIEFLSDRGRPVNRRRPSVRGLGFPAAIISLTTLVVAAVPLVLLDPDRVDGLAMLLALFIFPMIAGSLITEVVVLCKLQRQEPRWNLLWWPLVVLPTGLLVLSIGPLLAHPDYFDVTSFSSGVDVMFTLAFLVFFGLGLSPLIWMFVVQPLRVLGLAAFDALRGERVASFRAYGPLVLLAIPVISLLAVASVRDLEPGRRAAGQTVLALLGIPGEYEIAWEPGLWVVRGITLVLIGSAVWAQGTSRARGKKNQ